MASESDTKGLFFTNFQDSKTKFSRLQGVSCTVPYPKLHRVALWLVLVVCFRISCLYSQQTTTIPALKQIEEWLKSWKNTLTVQNFALLVCLFPSVDFLSWCVEIINVITNDGRNIVVNLLLLVVVLERGAVTTDTVTAADAAHSTTRNHHHTKTCSVCCDSYKKQGILRGFDQATNLILDECHERVYSLDAGVEQVVLGLYIIRGDNM